MLQLYDFDVLGESLPKKDMGLCRRSFGVANPVFSVKTAS
jgi:hypothetical protein